MTQLSGMIIVPMPPIEHRDFIPIIYQYLVSSVILSDFNMIYEALEEIREDLSVDKLDDEVHYYVLYCEEYLSNNYLLVQHHIASYKDILLQAKHIDIVEISLDTMGILYGN